MGFKLQHAVLGLVGLIIAFFGVDFVLETAATQVVVQSSSEKNHTVLKDTATRREYIVNRTISIIPNEDGNNTESLLAEEFKGATKLSEGSFNESVTPMQRKPLTRPISVKVGSQHSVNIRGTNSTVVVAGKNEAGSNQTLVTTPKDGANRNDSSEAATAVPATAAADPIPSNETVSAHVETLSMDANQTQLQARNYVEMARTGYFPHAADIAPLKVLKQHIDDFSQQRLEQMWKDCGNKRCTTFDSLKFVVGRYSCPIEAGNRLVKMMNGLLWAIVTQRVFMWDYWDYAACIEDFTDRCELNGTLNTPEDCAEILEVSKWVPSWDEWSVKLNLSRPVKACAVGKRGFDRFALPMDGSNIPNVIRTGQQINLEAGMLMMGGGKKFRDALSGKQSRNNAKAMFENGLYFGYGMLFESLFSLHPSLLPNPELVYDNDAVDTYVLHSRHTRGRDNGWDIRLDVSCMEKVVTNRTDPSKPCVVYSMTDRATTKEKLPYALAKFNCTAIFSTDTTQSTSFRPEHGPFAGRGYYQDLALVRSARRGIMAPNPKARPRVGIRTSTALVRSLIEFRRVLESPPGAAPEFKECYTH